jgi:hypothetical protein
MLTLVYLEKVLNAKKTGDLLSQVEEIFFTKERNILPPFQELIPRNSRKSQLLFCPRLPQLKAGIRS